MYKKIKVIKYECKCERCNHIWESSMIPNACAKCKSTAWNKEVKYGKNK